MNWVAGVILLALVEYCVFGMLVGRARAKYAIPAPAVSGNEMFERYFRVHQNTLELLIAFIPAIWLFGLYVSPRWGAGIGAVFLVGRILYARGYVRAPEQRELGAGLSFVPQFVLILGALFGVVRALLAS
jgi:uncharacterized membrane protein YecN with MAPEG domain